MSDKSSFTGKGASVLLAYEARDKKSRRAVLKQTLVGGVVISVSFDQVVERVIEVDDDNSLYNHCLRAPAIISNSRLHQINRQSILDRVA
jgi:hypothetical protein